MKLPSPLAHTAQSLPVTMLPTKNSLKSFKSVLARSDWPPVLFGSPVRTFGFDTRVRRSITGGAGLCSVSTSSRSVASSWDRCLSVNSLWGVIERREPRLRSGFSWRSVKRLICYKKRPTPHVSRPGIVTYERNQYLNRVQGMQSFNRENCFSNGYTARVQNFSKTLCDHSY